jgi:hypothetical protein
MEVGKAMDGKKTAAGASVSVFTGFLVSLGLIWGWNAFWWWPKMIETVALVGGFVSAVGLVHKVAKWRAARRGK